MTHNTEIKDMVTHLLMATNAYGYFSEKGITSLRQELGEYLHQQLQKARQEGYNAGLADGIDKPLLAIEQMLQKARADAQAEYKQFVLNVLDGIDIADGQCNTKAIRFALESRIIHSELDQPTLEDKE